MRASAPAVCEDACVRALPLILCASYVLCASRVTSAAATVTELVVAIGDKHIGPFEGTRVDLACLPRQNVTVRYQVDGIAKSLEVSPSMCMHAVALDVNIPRQDGAPRDAPGVPSDAGPFPLTMVDS